MKKNRNSFFSEANMSYANYNQNMSMPANAPFQGQNYNYPYPGMMPNNMGMSNDSELESRLAKIERQINRLEHRLNKLEATNTYINEDYESTTNNMYML